MLRRADEDDAVRLDPKLQWKLTAFLVAPITLLIVLNSLDRVNVSFASVRMNHDLGLSPQAYGFGVSIFFLGYVLLQFPSALSQARLGPRLWIFLLVLIWGLVATAMAFVSTPMQFYVLRFLLGAVEGGFAPGIMFYISRWAPRRYRGWSVAGTMLAVPISVVIGAPLSGCLMSMPSPPLGLAGWRWMFLAEGLAPVVLAFACLAHFKDRMEQALWLTDAEKQSLRRELDAEADATVRAGGAKWTSLISLRIAASMAVWFCLMGGSYGLLFWMPLVVKQVSAASDFMANLLSALPWAGIGAGMMLNAWHSDRAQERVLHFGIPATLAALFLAAAAATPPGAPSLICVTAGGFFLGAAQGAFWPMPISFMSGPAAAAGMALINMVGNSAGLVSPIAVGWLRERTGSFQPPIYAMAALMLVAALLMIPMARWVRRR